MLHSFCCAYKNYYVDPDLVLPDIYYTKYKRLQIRGHEYDYKGQKGSEPTGDDIRIRVLGTTR